jgi:hypothetical protein
MALNVYAALPGKNGAAVLRQLVAAYAIPAVRVPMPEAASLVASARAELVRTPCANAAVVFAPLRKADVITLVVELGMTLPADLPAAEKTARLQARLAGQCYRVYAEPTLVYDAE